MENDLKDGGSSYESYEVVNYRGTLWVILTVVLFVFIIKCSSSPNPNEEEKQEDQKEIRMMTKVESDPMLAYQYVKMLLPDHLVSPTSAKFPKPRYYQDHITDLGDHRYLITSYVDCQNGFGAMLRTQFVCTVVFDSENVWLENLSFTK